MSTGFVIGGIGTANNCAASRLTTDQAFRLYRASPGGAAIEADAARYRALAAARRPLLWIAVTHTGAAAVAAFALWHGLVDGDGSAQLIVASAMGIAAAFWAAWQWSAVAPLPAAVVGLVMYGSMSYLAYAAQPFDLPRVYRPVLPTSLFDVYDTVQAYGRWIGVLGGLAWAIIAHLLLVRAVALATAARRAGDAAVPLGGALPVLALYGLLLAVVARHSQDVGDVLTVMRLVAFVVVAAALVGWRTALPALADAGGAWLGVGVLMGLGTFALASLYTDGLSAAFGLSAATAGADPWVSAGYGWSGAIAATVLFPAVFEELAFRGLILPRLARLMTGGQAVFVSGAMFAVLHLNPTAVPFLLPMGVLLGVLRRRSGSVWPCILMHLTHNAAVLAVARYL